MNDEQGLFAFLMDRIGVPLEPIQTANSQYQFIPALNKLKDLSRLTSGNSDSSDQVACEILRTQMEQIQTRYDKFTESQRAICWLGCSEYAELSQQWEQLGKQAGWAMLQAVECLERFYER